MNDLIKNFAVFCFLLMGVNLTTFAQTGPPNGEDPPPVPTLGAIKSDGNGDGSYKLDGCIDKVPFEIYLANLVPYNEAFSLPASYPEMYLEYSIDGGPFVYSQLFFFNYVYNMEGYPVYKTVVESYPIDFSGDCDPLNGNNSFSVNYTMRLVTPVEDQSTGNITYETYSACDYTSEQNIFSCAVFYYAGNCSSGGSEGIVSDGNDQPLKATAEKPDSSTSGFGGDGPVECDQAGLTSISGVFSGGCGACSGFGFGGNSVNKRSTDTNELAVQPNPFNNNINLTWSDQSPLEGLRFYNSSGKLLNTWNKGQLEKSSELNIETDNLPPGVYFFHAISNETTKVLKVVKQ